VGIRQRMSREKVSAGDGCDFLTIRLSLQTQVANHSRRQLFANAANRGLSEHPLRWPAISENAA
jgi:hypothetical protein